MALRVKLKISRLFIPRDKLEKMKCIAIISICLSLFTNQHVYAQATSSATLTKQKKFVEQICFRIQQVAQAQLIPEAFLARLIWKESRFDPNAISPKGAQGIAQFMPGTAQLVGLADPFEPHSAIAASATYLNDLRDEFGNWGLAAAGYNSGPGRVAAWLAGRSGLPFETQDFVSSITGHAAEEWAKADFKPPKFSLSEKEDFLTACQKFPTRYSLYKNVASQGDVAPVRAWGVILTANFSRNKALGTYQKLQKKFPSVLKGKKPSVARKLNRSFGNRPRYEIQLGSNSRKDANTLCTKLKRAGGNCIVLRN